MKALSFNGKSMSRPGLSLWEIHECEFVFVCVSVFAVSESYGNRQLPGAECKYYERNVYGD